MSDTTKLVDCRIVLHGGANRGSFWVDAVAMTISGTWDSRKSVGNYDGEHDLCYIRLESEAVDYLSELLEEDDRVLSYCFYDVN